MSSYRSPFLRQGINRTVNDSKLPTVIRKPTSVSSISSSSQTLSSPRRKQLTTRNLRERPTRLEMPISERKLLREDRLRRVLDSRPSSDQDSHKRSHSSLSSPVVTPRSYSSVSKFGFEPISRQYTRNRSDDIMKRRKVVAFVESIDKQTPTIVPKTTRSPVDDMVISDSEEEETPLKSKQTLSTILSNKETIAVDKRETNSIVHKPLFTKTHATLETSAILELECEIKQIQLDNLRKFKTLQAQMELQAEQIQSLHEQNKQLLALVSKK